METIRSTCMWNQVLHHSPPTWSNYVGVAKTRYVEPRPIHVSRMANSIVSSLPVAEVERYSRQLILPEWGVEGW